MAKVSTRLPPIESAIEAKSWRLVTTLTTAKAGEAATEKTRARRTAFFIFRSSERMGAVRADRELELEEGFVRLDSAGVTTLAQLSPDLRELDRKSVV